MITKKLEGIDMIYRARARVMLMEPFFSFLVMKLGIVIDERVGTAAVDGKKITYSMNFFSSLSVDEQIFVVLHETLHVLLKHHLRRGKRKPNLWNMACDYIINAKAKKFGYKLPSIVLFSERFDGMCEEQVYDILEQEAEGAGGGEAKGAGGGEGEGAGGGEDETWNIGGVVDMPGEDGKQMSNADIIQATQDLDAEIKAAAAVAKKAGRLPAGMEVFIDEITAPLVNYREILARFISESAESDYSYRKLDRSALQRGMVAPTLKSEQLGEALLVVDTSGSTAWGDTRKKFLSEVFGLLEMYPCKVTVACADSEFYLTWQGEVGDYPDVGEMEFKGNGGTSFEGVNDFVEEHNLDPAFCIYFSDGDVYGWPDQPRFPCIMGVVGSAGSIPEWLETFKISD